ncbi:MAG: cell wall hydrolase [Oscillospiraceae bacterium]|nr:cell wall hydrolase [Oscillospiraceae bacterium]
MKIRRILAAIIASATMITCTGNVELNADNSQPTPNTTYFDLVFENYKFPNEIRDGYLLEYIYEGYSLIGFNYRGNNYYYSRNNSNNSVETIYDESGNDIARYEYNGYETLVYQKDNNDAWVVTEESSFIGNINPIRLHGYRFNEETDKYEYAGDELVLDDTYSAQSCNSYSNEELLLTYEDFVASDVYAPKTRTNSLGQSVDAWANYLYNSAEFRRSISYSSGWYSSLSDIEILCRLIYAENTTYADDQRAIAWVLVYRRMNSAFPDTLRGVATASGQFASITSTEANTQHSRNPEKTEGWRTAIWYACAISSSDSYSDYLSLFGKPNLYLNQMYFTSSNYFYNNCRDYNGKLQYKMDGTYRDVSSAAILGYSSFITNKTTVNSRRSSSRNLFFNI